MNYDYFLIGPSGQVGRHILNTLLAKGRIGVLMRRNNIRDAQEELRDLIGHHLLNSANTEVLLGDLLEYELPSARHFIHAGGLTTFSNPFSAYWSANVISTIKLAHHVKKTRARLHLISSISVAQHREQKLYENSVPIPHDGQSRYALSKCFAELAASAIVPPDSLSIYRISDVVPELARLNSDLRQNHWLTILMGTGFWKRCALPGRYEFHFVLGSDASRAIVELICDNVSGTFHLFGRSYKWGLLKQAAEGVPMGQSKQRLGAYISRCIGSETSLVSIVDDMKTKVILHERGLGWTDLSADYWKSFVSEAAKAFKNQRKSPDQE